MRIVALLGLAAISSLRAAEPPVYHLLWFDTEDYIEPSSDDAALRLADELTRRGVRATFKIVGEKARVLEQRGRTDVLRALGRHEIGFHSENHSIPPQPAVYLEKLGLLDGAAEFERREGPGFRDLVRIFGVVPSCYGQPGSSWGPQSNLALRRWGINVYMDDGRHVGLDDRPFWYGGLLYIFNLGPNTLRADINDPSRLPDLLQRYDQALAALRSRGGGVMQTYYHPTEFSTTEFWDAVNFARGANPERSRWKPPARRTTESTEQAFRLFLQFIDHVRMSENVRFVTASELRQLIHPRDQTAPVPVARRLAESIDVRDGYSPAEQLLALLALPAGHVDGPARRAASAYSGREAPRWAFERAKADAREFIQRNGRLPDQVWIGSETLSMGDFAASLAADGSGATVEIRRGKLDFERHVTKDAERAYNWVIHPNGFAPVDLLELGRLQAWTLKPARLR